jgi:hypothetical protein
MIFLMIMHVFQHVLCILVTPGPLHFREAADAPNSGAGPQAPWEDKEAGTSG